MAGAGIAEAWWTVCVVGVRTESDGLSFRGHDNPAEYRNRYEKSDASGA